MHGATGSQLLTMDRKISAKASERFGAAGRGGRSPHQHLRDLKLSSHALLWSSGHRKTHHRSRHHPPAFWICLLPA
ncbi:hypothetical protein ACFX2C_043900 [Malus domestica]